MAAAEMSRRAQRYTAALSLGPNQSVKSPTTCKSMSEGGGEPVRPVVLAMAGVLTIGVIRDRQNFATGRRRLEGIA